MDKKQLFEKYSINESHKQWDDGIDNWMSVEVYRIMHDGNLPPQTDRSTKWVIDFLDKTKANMKWWVGIMSSRTDWGSLYLTAKRMVYRFSDMIIEEIK